MAGRKPEYEAFISKGEGEKKFFTKIGAAWLVSKDGISIQLDAVPVDGRLVLFKVKEQQS